MPDRDARHLFPEFYKRLQAALIEFNEYLAKHRPGWNARLIEGFRSTARQKELYAQGRSTPGPIVTHKNGTTNPSNHQSGLAADIGVFGAKGRYIEDPDEEAMNYFGHCLRARGLFWGGDFPGSFKDFPHAEWPTKDVQTYKAAKLWLAEQGLK